MILRGATVRFATAACDLIGIRNIQILIELSVRPTEEKRMAARGKPHVEHAYREGCPHILIIPFLGEMLCTDGPRYG